MKKARKRRNEKGRERERQGVRIREVEEWRNQEREGTRNGEIEKGRKREREGTRKREVEKLRKRRNEKRRNQGEGREGERAQVGPVKTARGIRGSEPEGGNGEAVRRSFPEAMPFPRL